MKKLSSFLTEKAVFVPFVLLLLCGAVTGCSEDEFLTEESSITSEDNHFNIKSDLPLTLDFEHNYLAFDNGFFTSANDGRLRLQDNIDLEVDQGDDILISSDQLPFDLTIRKTLNSDNSFDLQYKRSDEAIFKTVSIKNSGFESASDIYNNLTGIGQVTGGGHDTVVNGCPPCVVIVIGIVVYAVVDHCDTVVEEGVAGCSRNGNCADVGACSVTCHSCDDNDNAE